MHRPHFASTSLLALVACFASGCCQPYGWVLKGDCALELNRVAWIGSRGDCYEGCQSCGAGGSGAEGEASEMSYNNGPYGPLDPAFHPVPMRNPYGPYQEGPTRAPEAEDLPTPPQDNVRAPAASVPRRLSDSPQRASWSYRKSPKPISPFGKQKSMHVWRPER